MVRAMDEDEMLKRMTKLLEQGCTMLASHHSCGAPLFRCQGEIICPVCSVEGSTEEGGSSEIGGESKPVLPQAAQKAEEELAAEVKEPSRSAEVRRDLSSQDEQKLAKDMVRRSLLHRLEGLSADLERESDLDKLRRQLGCIEGILNVLKSLET